MAFTDLCDIFCVRKLVCYLSPSVPPSVPFLSQSLNLVMFFSFACRPITSSDHVILGLPLVFFPSNFPSRTSIVRHWESMARERFSIALADTAKSSVTQLRTSKGSKWRRQLVSILFHFQQLAFNKSYAIVVVKSKDVHCNHSLPRTYNTVSTVSLMLNFTREPVETFHGSTHGRPLVDEFPWHLGRCYEWQYNSPFHINDRETKIKFNMKRTTVRKP